jgi:hypothetical protein
MSSATTKRQLFYLDTSMPYLYTLPNTTDNLLVSTIAGVSDGSCSRPESCVYQFKSHEQATYCTKYHIAWHSTWRLVVFSLLHLIEHVQSSGRAAGET